MWPLVVPSKIRLLFLYQRLDVRLRLRIRARRHAQGLSLSPVNTNDTEACAWIEAQAEHWGVVRWQNPPHRPGARGGWVKEKFQKRTKDVVK